MSECSDCRRILPDSETLYGGKCRICRTMNWRSKAVTKTPALDPGNCPACKVRKRVWRQAYCRLCARDKNKVYQRNYRERMAKAKLNIVIEPRMKDMSGVDIDRVHYKLGAVRKAKAA